MNNKGFTLIELLVTILLLSIISVISFVSVTNVIKQGKINDCNSLVSSIRSATKEYVSDHRYDDTLSITDNEITIDVSVLINNNYLNGPIYNPFDKSIISASDIIISVTLNNNYTVNSVVISSPAVLKDCKSE